MVECLLCSFCLYIVYINTYIFCALANHFTVDACAHALLLHVTQIELFLNYQYLHCLSGWFDRSRAAINHVIQIDWRMDNDGEGPRGYSHDEYKRCWWYSFLLQIIKNVK